MRVVSQPQWFKNLCARKMSFRFGRWQVKNLFDVLVVLVLFAVVVFVFQLLWRETAVLKQNSEVQVVVFEEHHEALVYWFDAANRGVFPKSGNTLIHIDGHSDDAMPDYKRNYPFFRWPRNKKDIKNMMQKNDIFINAAAMAGMFNRFVWIWPSWDNGNHETKYSKSTQGLGWFTPRANESYFTEKKAFCQCQKLIEGRGDFEGCYYLDDSGGITDGNIEEAIVQLDEGRCKVMAEMVYEEIRDDIALERMKAGNWFEDDESILLDIDEDYFGCESGADVFLKTKLPWQHISDLDFYISQVLCPQNTTDERIADFFSIKVIEQMIDGCGMSKAKPLQGQCGKQPADLKKMYARVNGHFRAYYDRTKSIFCHGNPKKKRKILRRIFRHLLGMNYEQLLVLKDVGFCLGTSPKGVDFHDRGYFSVCHGANTPNESIVTFHTPSVQEVEDRSKLMQDIITSTNYPTPKLITVCRSFRDGYQPKAHFERIERNVLNAVRNMRAGVKFPVFYDPDLLGGVRGWPSRHSFRNEKQMPQILK